MARERILMVGISSGVAAYSAVQVANRLESSHTVTVIFSDGSERYLSTGVFSQEGE